MSTSNKIVWERFDTTKTVFHAGFIGDVHMLTINEWSSDEIRLYSQFSQDEHVAIFKGSVEECKKAAEKQFDEWMSKAGLVWNGVDS